MPAPPAQGLTRPAVPIQDSAGCPGQVVAAASFVASGMLTVPTGSTASCLFKRGQTINNKFIQEFDDVKCDSTVKAAGGNAYCKRCKAAMYGAFVTVLLTAVSIPLCIHSSYRRASEQSDSNFEKLIGAAGNGLGGLLTLFGLYSFQVVCVKDLPSQFSWQGNTFSMSYRGGICYFALILAMVLLVVDGIIHFAVSTPERCWAKPPAEGELVALSPQSVKNYDTMANS